MRKLTIIATLAALAMLTGCSGADVRGGLEVLRYSLDEVSRTAGSVENSAIGVDRAAYSVVGAMRTVQGKDRDRHDRRDRRSPPRW